MPHSLNFFWEVSEACRDMYACPSGKGLGSFLRFGVKMGKLDSAYLLMSFLSSLLDGFSPVAQCMIT